MTSRKLWFMVGGVALLLLAAGVAGAFANRSPVTAHPLGAGAVGSGISYQGHLTGPDGGPLDGTYTMRFVLYDDEFAGSTVWDSGNVNVMVSGGLFNARLDVDPGAFDGQALWLSIIVEGEMLTPRQELLPSPYALSLRPGAEIVGDSIGGSDAVLAGRAPATGTALRAEANGGVGLFGDSDDNYGVWGASNNSWGGYFTSSEGYGVRVHTDGDDTYDHGVYVTSNVGYGVYAQSAQNQGVRGEAGDLTGVSQPLGAVGVVGLGANRGTYGASSSGTGLYGVSQSNYGLWALSTSWYGATGRTSRADNNFGLYTPDNLFAATYNFTGAVMQVMQNGGPDALSPGDVVAFSGVDQTELVVDSPIVVVRKANGANSTAVAGVVFSRFNVEAIDPALESADGLMSETLASMDITPAGDAAEGDYVLVVVQGLAQVKVGRTDSDIVAGDLLSAGADGGFAGKADTIMVDGVGTTLPGAVFGKALGVVDGSKDMMYVYVTLQ